MRAIAEYCSSDSTTLKASADAEVYSDSAQNSWSHTEVYSDNDGQLVACVKTSLAAAADLAISSICL